MLAFLFRLLDGGDKCSAMLHAAEKIKQAIASGDRLALDDAIKAAKAVI